MIITKLFCVVEPGTCIETAAHSAVDLSLKYNAVVYFEFNGVRITASPSTMPKYAQVKCIKEVFLSAMAAKKKAESFFRDNNLRSFA